MYYKNCPLCITTGSGKLKGIRSINTNPCTNEFCLRMGSKPGLICSKCYSQALVNGVYKKTCWEPWDKNGKLLSYRLLTEEELPNLKDKIFRFHSHGELINLMHLTNFVNIARHNPKTLFALYTKRLPIIREFESRETFPDNFILVFSTPKINHHQPILPAGFDRTFSVYSAQGAVDRSVKVNCTLQCATCQLCYRKGGVSMVNEVAKKEQRLFRELTNGTV